jgi:hypothetical protein
MEEERLASRQEGRQEVIAAFISLCQDVQFTQQETITRIAEKFSISVQDATHLVEKYW